MTEVTEVNEVTEVTKLTSHHHRGANQQDALKVTTRHHATRFRSNKRSNDANDTTKWSKNQSPN
nr:MAG: hypothetical protein AmFV_00201 [Apis mellifera filamentous virus]